MEIFMSYVLEEQPSTLWRTAATTVTAVAGSVAGAVISVMTSEFMLASLNVMSAPPSFITNVIATGAILGAAGALYARTKSPFPYDDDGNIFIPIVGFIAAAAAITIPIAPLAASSLPELPFVLVPAVCGGFLTKVAVDSIRNYVPCG
jgi:hypothetical protein